MKKQYLFVITLLFSLILNGQSDPNLVYEPKFSLEIEEALASDKITESRAVTYFSNIGEYEKAISSQDVPIQWKLDTMTLADRNNFLKFQPKNAFDYLSEVTKKEQIVIISEAHQKPQHRIFTAKMLKALYANGFRHLGIEAVNPDFTKTDSIYFLFDAKLNERGYALYKTKTGTYTLEPQMSNMIRTAIALGFKIFAYEKFTREKDRDLQQALNVQRYMNKHPDGKIVLHCGWFHAIESSFPKIKKDNWMAYHLKNITGIDPYTIYQDALSEKRILPESPYYQMIKVDKMSVLVHEEGTVFNGVDTVNHFDVLVYHPRTTYIKGRPNWLLELEGNRLIKIKKNKVAKNNYPVIVKAILQAEGKEAVPVDVLEIKSRKDIKRLVLPKGKYLIEMIDKNRKVISYMKNVN